ncbi:MAG: hypothetical protein K6U10_07280 [Acidobacteriia bacterium]|nr:hypothetical protein [Methyloceanibacter sp.]MCL6491604.1 hypothetical protein [Terriglobia bacterium]
MMRFACMGLLVTAFAFSESIVLHAADHPPETCVNAPQSCPYVVEANDVTAHVGEHAVMLVRLRPRDGYRVLEAYTNRLSRFSSLDGAVAFDRKMVDGKAEDGALVFAVGLTPTAPGRHPINGVFRVGYIRDPGEMWMISVPLIANVIGEK